MEMITKKAGKLSRVAAWQTVVLCAALPLLVHTKGAWWTDKPTMASECVSLSSDRCSAFMVAAHGYYYSPSARRSITKHIRFINKGEKLARPGNTRALLKISQNAKKSR